MARVDESSIANDRGYRDSLTKVEPYGVEHIPEVERHGKASSQFFIWFAAGLNFPIIVLGFSATYFGLSMPQAIMAIVAGALVGSSTMGLLSRMGVKLGIPQQMQARGPLGFVGNMFPVAYVNVFAGIGWAAVTVILGGKALSELTPLPFWVSALILMLIQLGVALMGYNLIHYLQKILAYVLLAGFVLITVVSLSKSGVQLEANPHAAGFLGAGGWITFFGYFLSYLIAWLPFASDYSRYLPDTGTTRRNTGIFTMLGNFVTVAWMGVLGVVLASSASTDDPITALHQLMGPWAVPGLLVITISALSQNFLNVYGGAISVQTMGIPVKRTTAVIFICIASYILSLAGETAIYQSFNVFLNLTAYCITPMAAVLICDYYLGGRQTKRGLAQIFDKSRKFEWGFVAWLAGVVGSSPFWVSSIYTGPIAAAFPKLGDLTFYVSAAIACIVYFLTYRLRPLSNRHLPALALDPHANDYTAAMSAAGTADVAQETV